jgi:hypothetical protein
MGGGLMQLVAYGAQDVYLTGNPQITFFKVVYRRHTNFSMETIEHTLNGNPDFGRKSSVTITRNGDLITKIYLRVVTKAVEARAPGSRLAFVRRLGHALIKDVEVEIGGSRIDKHYGIWLDIWYELARPVGDRERGYDKMIGDVPELTNFDLLAKPSKTLFIPLQFWFCRNTGLALPLIALQYHEVRLHFEFRTAEKLGVYDNAGDCTALQMLDASLLVDYIYLDSEERRRFAQVGHEYLIEQLQFTGEESVQNRNHKFKLGFNHPTKELVWALRNGAYCNGKRFLAYTNGNWNDALNSAAKALVEAQYYIGQGDPLTSGKALVDPAAPGPNVVFAGLPNNNAVASGTDPRVIFNSLAALTVDGVDLYSKITSATISVESANGVDADERIVTSVSHTLTIRDISFPFDSSQVNNQTGIVGVGVCQWNNYGILIDGSVNPVAEALIQLNGHDRFDKREGDYFNYVQPHQHHTNTPADGINTYSFALHPEQHQPSGTANLSRIDNTQLNVTFADGSKSLFGGNLDFPFLNDLSLLYIFAYLIGQKSILPKAIELCFWITQLWSQIKNQDASFDYNNYKNYIIFATESNCGKLLKLRIPRIVRKNYLAENKTQVWSQFLRYVDNPQPSPFNLLNYLTNIMDAVQRLNVSGHAELIQLCLSYSLTPVIYMHVNIIYMVLTCL